MAVGLKVWDAAGNLTFDSGTKLTRLLATFDSGTASGSAAFPATTNLLVGWAIGFAGKELPNVSISGNTVTWTFEGGFGTTCKILVLGY